MVELGIEQIMVPALVAAGITIARQLTERLDGPTAYWVSIGTNILGQILVALQTGGDPASAVALGVGTGAVVSPGLAAAGKRVGLAKVVKPRQQDPR